MATTTTTAAAVDINLFAASEPPAAVKSLPKMLTQSVSDQLFSDICVLCRQYLSDKHISKKAYHKTKQSAIAGGGNGMDGQSFDLILNGVLTLATACHRVRYTYDTAAIDQHLTKVCHLDRRLVNIFSKQLFDTKLGLKPPMTTTRQSLRLRSMRWRIDVAIANSMVSRIMEPLIVFEFVVIVSDGGSDRYREQTLVFECRSQEFHKFRYTVAHLVKRLNQIQC